MVILPRNHVACRIRQGGIGMYTKGAVDGTNEMHTARASDKARYLVAWNTAHQTDFAREEKSGGSPCSLGRALLTSSRWIRVLGILVHGAGVLCARQGCRNGRGWLWRTVQIRCGEWKPRHCLIRQCDKIGLAQVVHTAHHPTATLHHDTRRHGCTLGHC